MADVVARFENPETRDVHDLFNKLKQVTTVADYEDKFEELRAMVLSKNRGFTEEYFISSFMSGLKDHIKNSVRMFRPQTLVDTIFLAKQEETKSGKNTGTFQKSYNVANTTGNTTLTKADNKPSFSAPINYSSKALAKPLNRPKSTLSTKEILERREKGQCFHCDDPYHPGQPCKARLYVLMGEQQEEQEAQGVAEVVEEMEQLLVHSETPGEISINALSGSKSISTIRLQGVIKGKRVSVLIDSGSTHSFIDTRMVKQLGLVAEVVPPLIVSVADGSRIIVDAVCKDLQCKIQGHSFNQDLRLFPLGGSDVILGVDWLKLFNPITFDYQSLRITLIKDGIPITLQGDNNEGSLQAISGKKLSKMLKASQGVTQGFICMINATTVPEKPTIPTELMTVLQKYKSVFTEPQGLPPVRKHDHKIPLLQGSQPVNQRCYRVPYVQKTEIERQVKEMLNSGIIQESSSPFASPIILVKKKDGTWRMCVDYRRLNEITIKNKYPIPVIDELLDELRGASWFTKLDLRSGYHQIRVAPEDIHKTAFKTHQGLYEFKVMPFGLTNAPASFQSLMNHVFQDKLRKHVLVFFDDILVYSRTLEEHVLHVSSVLELMQQHQLFAKESKCLFGQQQLEYLGHIISKEGVSTDPSKVSAMLEWPLPKSIKQLRGFLGLTGYYRRFIKGYGVVSRPLNNLLKKGGFSWTDEATKSFEQLKQCMSTAPVLALPDYNIPFTIETDASAMGIGAVLMQKGRPLAFLSKGLAGKHQHFSTYEKELLAIVLATKKWYTYLQGNHFIIKTDHQSLKYLLEQKLSTLLQQKWLAKLMGLDYEIVYKKGVENKVADALSRVQGNDSQGELAAVVTTQPGWLEEVKDSYTDDKKTQEIIEGIISKEPAYASFTYSKGILRVGSRIYVGDKGQSRKNIMWELHDGTIGGHSGQEATLKRICQFFYWPTMKEEVSNYVKTCDICQRIKTSNQLPGGLLQPLPVPSQIWTDISMDFIEGLPKSGDKDCIMVVIDRFTKVGHFTALSHPYTATTVAQLFLDTVFKLHGMPQTIVSDRDKLFTSQFWKELFKAVGTKLHMSTSYHPQSDGQTERLNRCLEHYLRAMVSQRPNRWAKWLALAEWWYNCTYNSAIKMSPYEALYGVKPRQMGLSTVSKSSI